ncbi:FixH family protein [Lentzea sp. NBC_00516]|uniref:hypothetical protein n=1 Tax=Lentzea sp. NBC_00516 TaxID=2903582 RepID=UPI002E7FC532|nr:hypothetical protein [Lentzea sp. NBC_00516]WUD25904.1 FixH family protein [Lentzea sp. NBC_00516]
MKTGYKVALYAATLAAIFTGTWAAGAATGPPETPPTHTEEASHGSGTHDETQSKLPPGLSVSDNGYTLRLNENKSLAFQIEGPDGRPVTKFAVEHEKRLHLIIVRRDGSNFQHVHPTMAPDGTWSIPLTLPQAGSYRVFADFKPEDGPKTTLGADIQIPGDYRPQNHINSSTFTVDGYEVSLTGELNAGKASTVTIEITKNGKKVTDLQNYLGAKGHLVALRASDLAYLHVHPEQSDQVKFAVEVPTAGKYRLFLDFQHDNVVRTAEFTLTTHGEGGHGH